ncbi:S49 family peptidase [Sphingomonas sp. BAUL-RG-20F-R05-02]|uniref:S49 family peptidase n=1 Tax=Sphingomonas sp. BAUL-RG-20F-R05-02 TaxID=2914830 RepID=UPI001F580D02|nr:S49 family peptidase [Sphingomonas sp. BAUL-RG-20F-R05-02]
MKYPYILAAFASEIWAMEETKLLAIVDLLAMQAEGIKFSAEEIEAKISPQTAAAVARREGSVAVVPLRGVISPRASMVANSSTGGGATAEGFASLIDQMADDDTVKAIVVDADTPGGNVLNVDEAAASVAAAKERKPVIVQVTGNLASAGYWIGSSASEIVMSPSSAAGAIGVRTAYDDVTEALAKQGVSREIIAAGKFKGEGLIGPLSDDTRAYMQGRIDDYYGMFVDRVAAGRDVAASKVRDGFGQGRMLGAKASVAEGLADRVGTMKETLARFGVGAAPQGRGTPERDRRKRALALI